MDSGVFRRRTRLIGWGAALFAAGLSAWFLNLPRDLFQAHLDHWFLRISAEVLWWIASATLLFSGIALAREHRILWRPLGRIAAGVLLLCLPLLFSAFLLFATSILRNMDRMDTEDIAAAAEKVWSDPKLPNTYRSMISRMRAYQIWRDTGVTTKILTDRGEEVIYQPTRDEEDQAKADRRLLQNMDQVDRGAKGAFGVSLLVAVAAIAAGFRRRPQPPQAAG